MNNLTESSNPLPFWVWMQQALGIGNGRVGKILEKFGSAEKLYYATDCQRKESGVLTAAECRRLSYTKISAAADILKDCRLNNIKVISVADRRYPNALRCLADFPLVLYARGNFPDFNTLPCFCIVGPRKVSPFGEKSAFALAKRLSAGGMVIISGGAVGADTAAHRGALKSNGITVAVLPCGLLHEYLSENRPLRAQIVQQNGCLLSECPPRMGVAKFSFQVRNRLLSGLSLGVALVEAPTKSGALITAHHACEQGRDVFVVPGNPTDACYGGSNELLRDGARPLLHALDIFETYLPQFPTLIHPGNAYQMQEAPSGEKKVLKKSAETLSKQGKIVYNYLDKEKFTADDLAGCGLSFDSLLSVLTELEIEGFIEALPGGYYAIR